MSSYTVTESQTFTITHARHMATKVAADLKRMQRFYGKPSDFKIEQFESEITQFLKRGLLGTVTYGFKRDGKWIEPTLKYTAKDLAGVSANDDDPGRVRPGANTDGADFYTYMTYNAAWSNLSATEREQFEKELPFSRSGAPEPTVGGFLLQDKTYSSGGRALDRASVKGG